LKDNLSLMLPGTERLHLFAFGKNYLHSTSTTMGQSNAFTNLSV